MLSCACLAFRVMIYFFIILFCFQGELILDMTYGYEVKGRYDRMLDVSIRLNEFGIKTFLPGALLVNELPLCMYLPTFAQYIKLITTIPVRHIPAWVPYLSYQPLAHFGRNLGQELLDGSLPFVKESMVGMSPENRDNLLTAKANS